MLHLKKRNRCASPRWNSTWYALCLFIPHSASYVSTKTPSALRSAYNYSYNYTGSTLSNWFNYNC